MERPPLSTPPAENGFPPPELPVHDPEEAREKIAELIAQGVRPIISVPVEYAERFSREGLRTLEHTDWASGEDRSIIAGTIGADPFLEENQERELFEIDPAQVQMAPRFTGPDKAFHGVVVFTRGIPAEALHSIGAASLMNWSRAGEKEKQLPQDGEAAETSKSLLN